VREKTVEKKGGSSSGANRKNPNDKRLRTKGNKVFSNVSMRGKKKEFAELASGRGSPFLFMGKRRNKPDN